MARQRHYRNVVLGGEIAFVTTTVLDFAPVFRREAVAAEAVSLLMEVHRHHRAKLHGYVLMPEHLHVLTGLPSETDVAKFVRVLKSWLARALLPRLNASELRMLSLQTGLNQRRFWQRSFHSFPVVGDEVFIQKLAYIHNNPVKRGLVEDPLAYAWSSARLHEQGLWSPELGLPLDPGQLLPAVIAPV